MKFFYYIYFMNYTITNWIKVLEKLDYEVDIGATINTINTINFKKVTGSHIQRIFMIFNPKTLKINTIFITEVAIFEKIESIIFEEDFIKENLNYFRDSQLNEIL